MIKMGFEAILKIAEMRYGKQFWVIASYFLRCNSAHLLIFGTQYARQRILKGWSNESVSSVPSFPNCGHLDLASDKMLESTGEKMDIEGIKLGIGIA